MKKLQYSWLMVSPFIAMLAAFLVGNQPLVAQRSGDSSSLTTPQQSTKSNNQDVSSAHTFGGRIVKSGNKVVLADAYNQTIFQLDDQQKAQDFLNKSVRVTGILDPSTGTIHVTAIEPV